MQAAQLTSATPVPTHSADGKFLNDGSLESVERMLYKFAIKCNARVLAMGLPMQFDDVMQEMRLSYVKAHASWSPEKARFNTYCFTVARNDFNNRIARMSSDRANLGLVSIDSLLGGNADTEGEDGYSVISDDDAQQPSPLDRMVSKQNIQDRLTSLTAPARLLIRHFIKSEMTDTDEAPNLRKIAANIGLSGTSLLKVQRELQAVFGVRLLLTAKRESSNGK